MAADFGDDIYKSLVRGDETETFAVVNKDDIENHSGMEELVKDFFVEMVHVLSAVYLGELQTNNNMMVHLHSHLLWYLSFIEETNGCNNFLTRSITYNNTCTYIEKVMLISDDKSL